MDNHCNALLTVFSDPETALQQLSYFFYESILEVTQDICVTLKGPAGGLSESVQV